MLGAVATATPASAQVTNAYLDGNATSPIYSGYVWPFHYAGCEAGYSNSQSANSAAAQSDEFTLSVPYTEGMSYQAFWSTDSSCVAPDGGANNLPMQLNLIGVGGTPTEDVQVNLESVLATATGATDPCDSQPPLSGTGYVCVNENGYGVGGYGYGYGYGGYGTTSMPFYVTVEYDMAAPQAPGGFAVTPADGELDVSWTFPYAQGGGDNADHFVVFAQEDPATSPDVFGTCQPAGGVADGGIADGGPAGAAIADGGAGDGGAAGGGATDGGVANGGSYVSSTASSDPTHWAIQQTVQNPGNANLSYPMTGLTNGVCYDVAVIAFYSDGTQGNPTATVTAAPIEILDYWRLYRKSGGQDPGGLHCQAAGGGLAPLAFVLAALVFFRSRRRRT